MPTTITLADIKKKNTLYITPAEAASVIGGDAQYIRMQAHTGELPFPYRMSGNRVKIERLPFIRYAETGNAYEPDGLSENDIDRIAQRLYDRLAAAGAIIKV